MREPVAFCKARRDGVEAPDSRDGVRKPSLLFKQRLGEIKARHPAVIAELRGEGLLLGLRAVVPSGDLVTALRAEKLLAVGAGDNVVRLLPPLIAGDAEVAQAIEMIDRAATRIASTLPDQAQLRGAGE